MKRFSILLTSFLLACLWIGHAAQLTINTGTTANDGTGDSLRSAMGKVNTNFTEVYNLANSNRTSLFGPSTNGTPLRFTRYAPTIASLLSLIVTNDVHTNALVAGYSAAGDGGGGLFYYDAGSSAATNLGTVFAPVGQSGRWLRIFSGPLDVRWFGAKCDGSAVDSLAVSNAVTTLGNLGGTVYIPAQSVFTLVVTNQNINLLGDGGIKDYNTGVPTANWKPASISSPLITVGTDINDVKGFSIRNATLYGRTASGHGITGIYFAGGAQESYMANVGVWDFSTNLYYRAGATHPSTVHRFYAGWLQQSTNANSRSIYAIMPNNQTSYTTDLVFSGLHVNGNTNGYAAEFDGTFNTVFSGSYFDIESGYGIKISKSGVGQVDPIITSNGLVLDAGGGGKVLTLPTSPAYAYDRIHGYINTSGYVERADGSTNLIPALAETNPHFYAPRFFNQAEWVRASSNQSTGLEYIKALDNGTLYVNSTSNLVSFAGGWGFGTTNHNPGSATKAATFHFGHTSVTVGALNLIASRTAGTDVVGLGLWNVGTATNQIAAIYAARDGADDAGALKLYTKPTGGNLTAGWTIGSDFTLANNTTNRISLAGAHIIGGSGSPEGVYTAPVGSFFLRTDGGAGTSLYTKTNGTGNTGWSAR